jgi:histidinol-phosphate aminotransferase
MKKHFKPHINNIVRYQTSIGRDLEKGLRLDRNEKVSNFPSEVSADIFNRIKSYSLSASPEPNTLYQKIAMSLGIQKEKIYITSGITEGIRILFETLTNPGDNVVVLDPTYPMYSIYAKIYQNEYRRFGFKKDLSPDWNSLYQGIDERTTMVMIPNPNLPIENMFSIEKVRHIADKCKENQAVLVIDEAYHYFGAPTVIELIDDYDNLVVMRSFSKAYGLAGIRLGFMISSVENIQYLSKTRSLVESNTLSMEVTAYMLDHPELLQEHVREVKEGAQYIQKELTKLGLRWFGGNVTNGILIFLNNENETKDLVEWLKKKNIYIRGSFEPPYNICVRVSIGPKEIMKIFADAFRNWLGK